jgi:hypothetical protein
MKKLTKHEMCMALAAHDMAPALPGSAAFSTRYDDYYLAWLAGYTFVKQLGPNEALYLVALHDDEGPNPYEGVCACFAHLRKVNGTLVFTWAEWPPAM